MKRPEKFVLNVRAELVETMFFEGWTKTGDQLFSDKKKQLPPLIFHVFHFKFHDHEYEFKVQDRDRTGKYTKKNSYPVYLTEDNLNVCWFEDEERKLYLREPDEVEDE